MRFQCPYCRNVVAVENSDLGLDVQCGHCSEVVTVPSSRISRGCLIADFIVQEELGRGGMGVVYLSHQISLDRLSALKVLADQYANDAEFVVGFIKEARAAAKLNHPHIVQAYAVGEDEGVFYFAMENVVGETMKEVQHREKIISVDKAVMVIQQIAEALDYAWKEAKLVHRDIKPDNIMMTNKGAAKLADLGLARVAGDIDDSDSDEVMGTPQYISPEHLTGAPMDVRSDLYSLGATFFHMITGRFAFEGKSATIIAQKHLQEQLQPPIEVNPEIPQEVSDIIVKMMEKNPKKRYQDAETLVDDLRIVRRGKGKTSASAGDSDAKNTSSSKSRKFKVSGTSTSISKTGSISKTKLKISDTNKTDTMNATGTHSAMLRNKQEEHAQGSKKKIIIMGVAGFVLLTAAAGYLLTSSNSDLIDTPLPSKEQDTTAKVVQVIAPTAIADKAKELMSLRTSKPDSFLIECREFFNTTEAPLDPKELIVYNELNEAFVTDDENKKNETKRKKIREQLAEIAKNRAAEQAEKDKQNEKNNIADLKAKLLNKFRDKKKEFISKQKEAIENVKTRYYNKQNLTYKLFITATEKYEYDSAKNDLAIVKNLIKTKKTELTDVLNADYESLETSLQYLIKPVKYKELKKQLTTVATSNKATKKQLLRELDNFEQKSKAQIAQLENLITNAESLWTGLNSSGSDLKGAQFEVNKSLAYLKSINNGFAEFTLSSGKVLKLSFDKLGKKLFHRLLTKVSDELGLDSSAIYSLYLCNGNISSLQLAPTKEDKALGYKLLILHFQKSAKFATKSQKPSLIKKINYLVKKFETEFPDEASALSNASSNDDTSGLSDL